MKDIIGLICVICGLAGGIFIGYLILSSMESGWGVLFLFVTTAFGGVIGGKLGVELGENIDNSFKKSNSKPTLSITTQNNDEQLFRKIVREEIKSASKELKNTAENPIMMQILIKDTIQSIRLQAHYMNINISDNKAQQIINEEVERLW